ncbi:MAG: DUF3322 domain-containing protein [Desulfobacteraceae bacterium]|jgi:hypothetical protein|nr:DUF3322 domain-containing protein [Desulfobacteraceae bacterium]
MTWTSPSELRAQVQRLWDRGLLLAELVNGTALFPRRLQFKGPNSSQMGERFDEVRRWIARLNAEAKYYRVVWRRVRHRVLGTNTVPAEIWIDSLDDALEWIGRRKDAHRFVFLLALTRARQPELIAWMAGRPLRALELADDWKRLLNIVAWVRRHPRPGIYLRQVDIPGVHTKFIEAHRAVLEELLDLALPPEAVDDAHRGLGGFCARYGFADKPPRQRFRLLDAALALLATGTDQDFTVSGTTFARLQMPVRRVFITENEINFLAFPRCAESLVIFGAGYGFESLAEAGWLYERQIFYWGDIDTHGFAILDQLRAHFPRAASFLMDRATLLAHRDYWGTEPRPETRDLPRLTAEEGLLYDDLRQNRLGERLRLEQETIGFGWVKKALAKLEATRVPSLPVEHGVTKLPICPGS